jgi:hypothetical protein
MQAGITSLATSDSVWKRPVSVYPPCSVCSSQETALYLDGDEEEISPASVGSSRVLVSHGRLLRCNSCGLVYRLFRPQAEQLSRLYRIADDSTYEAEMPNRWKTAARHRQIVHRYMPMKGSLLDVGCASGAFLRVAEVSRLRQAQPICEPGFAAKLSPIQTPIAGLQIADTCIYYPEDRSIAESVKLGLTMARSIPPASGRVGDELGEGYHDVRTPVASSVS